MRVCVVGGWVGGGLLGAAVGVLVCVCVCLLCGGGARVVVGVVWWRWSWRCVRVCARVCGCSDVWRRVWRRVRGGGGGGVVVVGVSRAGVLLPPMARALGGALVVATSCSWGRCALSMCGALSGRR